jgi:hypothetical protein
MRIECSMRTIIQIAVWAAVLGAFVGFACGRSLQ